MEHDAHARLVLSQLLQASEVKDNGLVVKPSSIKAAGLGLYTTKKRDKGEVVAVYTGTELSTVEAMRTKDKSYLMRLGPQLYIDAKNHPHVLPRYINDCRNSQGYNVAFDKKPEAKCAWVVATRDIEPFCELFVDYGRWYWASLEGNKLSDQQILEARLR
ncbi:unnamed protein product [Chrysoparadoxa australica]